MSYLEHPDIVRFACSCGLLKPIFQLYFCRFCSEIRCGFCLCHEVDSHYCGKCSENLPSSEARLKKNRCGNCFVCPSCKQDLSTRVAVKNAIANSDDPKDPKKMHYLSCVCCRWSSRDIGLPDQASANGPWPERENVNAIYLQDILDKYKAVCSSQKQKAESSKKKQTKYISYTGRSGLTAAALRKRIGLPDVQHPLLKSTPKLPEYIKASNEIEELSEDIFTKPLNLLEITTIEQRLLQPEMQPELNNKLFPIHKQLCVKQTLRCRKCDHNVCKPEINPNSVKFKIQLLAFYYIPEVRFQTVQPLRAKQACELILKFTNPTQHQTTIKILPLDYVGDVQVENVTEQVESVTLAAGEPNNLVTSKQPSQVVQSREIKQIVNCDVDIPESSFILPQRDDAAEYDDSVDTDKIQDDPKLVVKRKCNKALIKLIVTPNDLPLGTEVFCGFIMQHDYTNMIASKTVPQQHNIKVFLKLGNLVGSD